MLRKIFTIFLLLMSMVLISGCSTVSNNNPTVTPTYSGNTNNNHIVTTAPTSLPTAVQESTPISLSGSGDQATDKFQLQQGLSIITMKYDGSDNFIVKLMDHNGQLIDYPANVIGSYDGSQAEEITSAGDYLLNVQSSGPWTITITQPRPTTADSAPVTLSGSGPIASKFIYLNGGLATFKMSYSGSDNFIVKLLDNNGALVDLPANEIGSYRGSQAVTVYSSGIYLLDVNAAGNWQIDVSQ